MSGPEHLSLSGDWTGVYDYDSFQEGPIAFVASLLDVAGVLWGDTEEPNTFLAEAGETLFASLDGSRSGREVTFVKSYAIEGPHRLLYVGEADPKLMRIAGTWALLDGVGAWGGPFVMNRRPPAAAVARDRVLEAEALFPIGGISEEREPPDPKRSDGQRRMRYGPRLRR